MFRWLHRKKNISDPVRASAGINARTGQALGQHQPVAQFDIASLELGRFSEAEDEEVKKLEADSGDVIALKRLATLATQQGRDAQAIALITRAIAVDPLDADAHFRLGKIHIENDRNEQAAACFKAAVGSKPDYAEAHYGLGNALKNQGKVDEALASYRKAVSFNAAYAEAYNNMGVLHHERGRRDDAIPCYRKAAALDPKLAFAHLNLAILLLDDGRGPLEALDSFKKAIALEPDIAGPNLAHLHNSLGILLQSHGMLSEALTSFQNAVDSNPHLVEASNNLGMTLAQFGRHGEAVQSFRHAITIKSDFAIAYSNLLFCLSHDANIAAEAIFAEHCAFGDRFEGPLRDAWQSHTNSPDRERKLRVGFVSADLRAHAVATFIEPVWAELDKRQFEIWVYSNSLVEDEVTQRLKKIAPQWCNVAQLSDDDLAAKIRENHIDILFDLSGHTADNRLLTFARKPAPIQISWIGNPSTTGLKAMDYYLADRYSAPPGMLDALFTEKIVQLPSGALFQPFEPSPDVNNLPAMESGVFTFGSFTRSDKLAESVIMLWSKTLKSVPGSRLLLGGVSDAAHQENLSSKFVRHGVEGSRLFFFPRSDMAAYLGLHHKVDLILDTFPFGGGTTSCHAAWMGVPILTLAGKVMSSRVGVIINSNLNLTDFIAGSEDEFVAKAMRWTQKPHELAAIRVELRSRLLASPFCQPPLVARWVETALRTMWHRWCDGLPPESFDVKP